MHFPLFIAHGDILLMLMVGGLAFAACIGVIIALVTSAVVDTKEDRELLGLRDSPPEPPKLEEKT